MTTIRPTWGEVFEASPSTTADDLLRLSDDGGKYELFEGMLVRELTSPAHGEICRRLGVELGIDARGAGYPNHIVQNALFSLSVPGASTPMLLAMLLAPDLAILRTTSTATWTVPNEAPLLAVEVVSDSQTLAEMALKAQTYRNAGVEEIWVVDHISGKQIALRENVWATNSQRRRHEKGWSYMPQPIVYLAPENLCYPLASAADLDHRAQAAGAGLDGLWAAIQHHVPVLQVQTELALGVPV